ncbi:hypothetical protein ACP4OV_009737 [Aristida adscensionis]
MDRRPRAAPAPRAAELSHHQRFLRPGALARLRDSRIVARSLRSAAACLLLPRSVLPAPPSPARAAADQGGALPRFMGAGGAGPRRYPLRMRVAAARCVAFLPPPPPPEHTEAALDLASWR